MGKNITLSCIISLHFDWVFVFAYDQVKSDKVATSYSDIIAISGTVSTTNENFVYL